MKIFLMVVVVSAGGTYYYLWYYPLPDTSTYRLDFDVVRQLALSQAGELPLRINARWV
ncbi:MAG: hypothetical protein AAF512_10055 [Pseudomonadota bacterium]